MKVIMAFINRKGRFKGRLSPIEMLVLGTLKERALFGNEIMDRLKDQFRETSFIPQSGTIYPLLERLENKKILNASNIKEGKKIRKKYELTKKGQDILLDILKNREFEREIEFSNKFIDFFFSKSFFNFIKKITEVSENIAEIGENLAEGFNKSFNKLKLNRLREEIKVIQSQILFHEGQLKNLIDKKREKENKIQQLEGKEILIN